MVFKRNDNTTRLLSILSMVFRMSYIVRVLFFYVASERINIRIHKEDGPPNNPSGKPAKKLRRTSKIWFGVG